MATARARWGTAEARPLGPTPPRRSVAVESGAQRRVEVRFGYGGRVDVDPVDGARPPVRGPVVAVDGQAVVVADGQARAAVLEGDRPRAAEGGRDGLGALVEQCQGAGGVGAGAKAYADHAASRRQRGVGRDAVDLARAGAGEAQSAARRA